MFEPEAEGSCVSLRGGPQLLELPRRSGRLGPTRVTGSALPAAFNRHVATYPRKRIGGGAARKSASFTTDGHHSTVCYAIRRIEASRDACRGGQPVEGVSRGNQIWSGKRCP
jgi:hypothetical protein